ncbi:MAG: SH3 domain-containing protein [Lachnospiraceae bacterium]|nr:SH3 domain-containing protein [Lachnospiraceae bacterium]
MGYIEEKGRKWIMRTGTAFAGILCAVVLAFFSAGEVQAQAEGTVTASSANIRSSADTGSTAVASVVQGNKLTITEEVTGADGQLWYKVFVDADSLGYIRADLVSKDGGSVTTTTPAPAANTGTTLNTNVTVNTDGVEAVQPVSASVTQDQVRVRADSSTSSDIVTTIKTDVVFTVHGTKTGSDSKVWYQVSFMVDGTEVKGYIRSDYVTLDGELLPVTDTTTDNTETPTEPVPEETVAETKSYETEERDGVWHLVDNVTNPDSPVYYPIAQLISSAEQNAEELVKTQNKVSRQTGVIVVLAILLVVMLLGITLLIFKIKDMMEEDGFDFKSCLPGYRAQGGNRQRPARPLGSAGRQPVARPNGTRPTGTRPTGAAGNRPAGTTARPTGTAGATGTRPTGAAGNRPAGTTGARPAGAAGNRPAGTAGATGARPAGTAGNRPAGTTGTRPTGAAGNRPAGTTGARPTGAAGARPAGTAGNRPTGAAGNRPTGAAGTRPAGTAGARPAGAAVSEERLERQAKAHVEARNLEKNSADSQTWKSKNFMAEDDEFEFEFLNWDGEEEK